ncbi:hypothetical protein [Neoaquamicrobium sediminum]|uniref:hypothetical protein n=1 Tax=Neoaquamicrobium sediminum TaxID=1849104 RepID=UPI001564996E|nr:hypothetical protein [Mesorhizobium sediminum]NRC57396.1 hypothetical protein [Mesorhizobium sediminum]
MATEELFHEMGVWPEVEAYLEHGAQDETVDPDQRIKALDGLAFADIKAGSDRAESWLDQMDALITANDLGAEERLRVGMKRMSLLADKRDRRGAMRLATELGPLVRRFLPLTSVYLNTMSPVPSSRSGMRTLRPNGSSQSSKPITTLIGLTPEMVIGNNAPDLARMMKKGWDVDDVKHLADALTCSPRRVMPKAISLRAHPRLEIL